MTPCLYLIPSTIGETAINKVIPNEIITIINQINFFIVENERTVRRFLIKAGIKTPIDDLIFYILNKHTSETELSEYLKPIENGYNMGIISEAGCPGVADPGAAIVKMAHQKNIKIVPLVGPSSILLALMASGMNGQNFAFVGYIPVKNKERTEKIRKLEKRSQIEKQTQIFIEAPYRNMQLLDDILKTCNNNTQLCIAADITTKSEYICTKTIAKWKTKTPALHKRPTIFLLNA